MKDQNYLLTGFHQFSLGVRWVSAELEQLRTELDARTPQSSFSFSIKQRTHPLRIAGGLVAFTLATLFFDALPARLILSVIFVLVIYEAVAMANDSRPDGHDSLVGGASISFLALLAVVSIWILSPRDLLTVVLLVVSARTFGNVIDRQYPCQPLPRPCPNLYLKKTWFGVLGTIVLPVFITTFAIRLQLFDRDYWGLAGVGLVTVLADLAVASAKRHYGFHYSNEAAEESALVSVTIPGSTKTIGRKAFAFCQNLVSASISDGVVTIGEQAFRGCKIKYIDFPETIESVGAGAFMSCRHKWSGTWTWDGGYHWHECTANDCSVSTNDKKDSYAVHSYGDEGICTVCGYVKAGSENPSTPVEPNPEQPKKPDVPEKTKPAPTIPINRDESDSRPTAAENKLQNQWPGLFANIGQPDASTNNQEHSQFANWGLPITANTGDRISNALIEAMPPELAENAGGVTGQKLEQEQASEPQEGLDQMQTMSDGSNKPDTLEMSRDARRINVSIAIAVAATLIGILMYLTLARFNHRLGSNDNSPDDSDGV